MLRYSCDLCGRDLCPGVDTRFVVKIEVYPATDPVELTDSDLTSDALENLSDLLKAEGPGADIAAEIPPARSSHRFDLCPLCHARYVRNPLKRENEKTFQFSKN
jgi:hypothetical protein